jgi:hypothetical protein
LPRVRAMMAARLSAGAQTMVYQEYGEGEKPIRSAGACASAGGD